MGAWGTGLYSDDYTADIRGDYLDCLKKGKTNKEALRIIFEKDGPEPGSEDEPAFWYALADMLWNYGRLIPEVKEKALYFLENAPEDDRWDSPTTLEKRKQVLAKLKEKLLTEQPPEKKVRPYVYYNCPWKLGDVFAYQMHKKVSEEYGMKGKYIVFRKITEAWGWPDNIVPVIQIYRWIGDELPTLDEIRNLPVIRVSDAPYRNDREQYLFELSISSTRALKMLNCQYLGNIQDEQLFDMPSTYRDSWVEHYSGKATNIFEEVFFLWFMTMKDGQCVFRDDV